MRGEFTLKTSDGELPLRFTKRAFYEFEKRHDASLLSFFTKPSDSGDSVKMDLTAVLRFDVQIDLAFLAQVGQGKDRLSTDKLIDVADEKSLLEMAVFAIEEYVDIRGFKDKLEDSKPSDPH